MFFVEFSEVLLPERMCIINHKLPYEQPVINWETLMNNISSKPFMCLIYWKKEAFIQELLELHWLGCMVLIH